MDEQTEETWLPVVGYEGFYEVSDLGRVRSLARSVKTSNDRVRKIPSRVLRPQPDQRGYLKVHLCKYGTRKTCKIHHIVAEAFLGPRMPDTVVEHINQDRKDNRKDNLEYMSRHLSDVQGGTRTRGYKNGNCKLTEDDVRKIRADDRSLRDIALDYSLSPRSVRRIQLKKQWGWLPDEERGRDVDNA